MPSNSPTATSLPRPCTDLQAMSPSRSCLVSPTSASAEAIASTAFCSADKPGNSPCTVCPKPTIATLPAMLIVHHSLPIIYDTISDRTDVQPAGRSADVPLTAEAGHHGAGVVAGPRRGEEATRVGH